MLRDLLSHRGPDGAGLWDGGHVLLTHRRLAVIDPTPAADQPFVDPQARGVLAYNGEMYNDDDLRRELEARGVRFRTRSDTETVLHALLCWGADALARFRGMFALAFYDARSRSLLLARDPLGIKPLYVTRTGGQTAFASEVRPLLRLPGFTPRPDLVTLSAYLTTIRTTLGRRTLYEGVETLEPGEWMCVRPAGDSLSYARGRIPRRVPRPCVKSADHDHVAQVREAVRGSVLAHLRSDVPACLLLSGGLDSTIIATAAAGHPASLHTYCSGAAGGGADDDFTHARRVAASLGSLHTEAPVSREHFRERWPAMVAASELPLSTPNEVAIHHVASTLRAQGMIVALSGEGADELFCGYSLPMRHAAEFVAAGGTDGGMHQLDDAAWVPRDAKPAVLSPDVLRSIEGDGHLAAWYQDAFTQATAEAEDDADGLGGEDTPLQAHARLMRRVNLAGLLLRLDSATMRAGVEGRTPFADVDVAALAERLPMRLKFDPSLPPAQGTKRCLRAAFRDDVPAEVLARDKASFPLPFQEWVRDLAPELLRSAFAAEVFTHAALHTVAARPGELWRLAWPMINVALWGRRWA